MSEGSGCSESLSDGASGDLVAFGECADGQSSAVGVLLDLEEEPGLLVLGIREFRGWSDPDEVCDGAGQCPSQDARPRTARAFRWPSSAIAR